MPVNKFYFILIAWSRFLLKRIFLLNEIFLSLKEPKEINFDNYILPNCFTRLYIHVSVAAMAFEVHLLQVILACLALTFINTTTSVIIFYLFKQKWFFKNKLKLNNNEAEKRQIRSEIFQQILSNILVIGVISPILIILTEMGISKIYYDINEYPIIWHVISLIIMLVISDIYVFFCHSILHSRFMFKNFHKTHHQSTKVNVFSGHSLDFIESLLYNLILVVFVVVLPSHIVVYLLFIFITNLYNYYIHSGYEILPVKSKFLKYFCTATHHNIHHIKHYQNRGFYTNIWDRLFGFYKKDL